MSPVVYRATYEKGSSTFSKYSEDEAEKYARGQTKWMGNLLYWETVRRLKVNPTHIAFQYRSGQSIKNTQPVFMIGINKMEATLELTLIAIIKIQPKKLSGLTKIKKFINEVL